MLQFTKGMVVKSNAGHDQNRFYLLVGIEDGFGLICDGKRRKLEAPKRKNLLHLSKTLTVLDSALYGTNGTNQKIRRALFPFNYGDMQAAD